CGAVRNAFCAPSDADAQAYVDATYGAVPHGDISTDPDATAPPAHYVCASGADCALASNETMATGPLYAFTDTQLQACEAGLDMNCTWTEVPNDSCPAQ